MHCNFIKASLGLCLLAATTISVAMPAHAGRCNYPDDLDARGRRCGGRAASVRPGGYEPPPRSSDMTSSRNTLNHEDWIQGAGFSGACVAKPNTNLRSGSSLSSRVIGNTGAMGLQAAAATIHSTHLYEGGVWAWVTINGVNAWVRSDTLYSCSDN